MDDSWGGVAFDWAHGEQRPVTRRPATARDRLVLLLETYGEAVQTLGGRGDGNGDHVPAMSQMWHAGCSRKCASSGQPCRSSYAELERALHRMASERPKQWRQVNAQYVWPSTRTIDVVVGVRSHKGGLTAKIPRRTVVPAQGIVRYNGRIRRKVVESGISYLLGTMFGGRHELIQLPRELWEEVAA